MFYTAPALIFNPVTCCLIFGLTHLLDSSREVISSLVEEYQAAERPDYTTWGLDGGATGIGVGAGSHRLQAEDVDAKY